MDCRYVAVPASRRTSRAGARQQLLDDRGFAVCIKVAKAIFI